MVYKFRFRKFRKGPKFSGQSKTYLAARMLSKAAGVGSKGGHRIGVAAVGGYHVAKRAGRYHPFNLIPKKPMREYGLSKKKTKSKRGPGSARKRTGRPKSRKTMRARSAPKPKMVRYRKGGCPPGYRYDPRRKMCIQNNYK